MANPATHTPRALIDAPPLAPRPPFGLLDSARVTTGLDELAGHGVTYPAVCDTTVTGWPLHCSSYQRPDGHDTKTASNTRGWTHADPFAVYAADDCLRAGDETAAVSELRDRFLLGEGEAVERIVYTGELNNRPAITIDPLVLNTGGTAPPAATPLSLSQAIGLLEHWLAHAYGQTGMIHLPRWMGELVGKDPGFSESGPRAVSTMRSTLVFGTGYDGRAPTFTNGGDAGAADAVWLYATLPITVRRSELVEPAGWAEGAFNTRTNRPFTLVERVYVIDWPCQAAAVPVQGLSRLSPDAVEIPAPAPAATEGTNRA